MPEETKRGKYIRERIHNPKGYVRYRTKALSKEKGIKAVIGILPISGKRGGRTEIESVLVPKKLGVRKARRIKKEVMI